MTLQRRAELRRTGFTRKLPASEPRHAAPGRLEPLIRAGRLRARSARTERVYRQERRPLVAALFAEPSVCEVPWCPEIATDPHEPLTRARGGSIVDRSNIRLVCHGHNVMFSADEQPWMYSLGFLVHSWDRGRAA